MQTKHLFILLLVIAFKYLAFSQSHDRYEYKTRENRMEGRERKTVSAPGLELLSFLAYKEELGDPDKNVDLKIRFYLEESTSLYITAKELNIREFYKMRPLQTTWSKGWQEFASWSTGEVLHPLGLSPNDLGIIGRIQKTDRIGSCKIAPLIIYYSKLPNHISQYTLHFIPKQDLKKVEYTLYKFGEKKPILSDRIMEIFGGVPFSITIDLSAQMEGDYQLVVDCRYKNRTGGPQRTYTFYHNPEVK